MSFRRDKQRVADARRWRAFVDAQAEAVHAVGLDAAVLRSPAHFVDFLEHGYLGHHHHAEPSVTSSWTFDHDQRVRLAELAGEYFRQFGGTFDPIALGNQRYVDVMRRYLEAHQRGPSGETGVTRAP